VLDSTGRINAKKTGMLFFDSFSNSYFSLGEKAGNAWGEGKKYL
ncbi:flavin reductase family protein, partial [Clostridium beijerinckii]|nr:flavin reductase family protein [Clostridium beijerinckii]